MLSETHICADNQDQNGNGKSAVEIYVSVCRLITEVQSVWMSLYNGLPIPAVDEDAISAAMADLEQGFRIEVSPPAGMGFRQTTVIHKAHALAHQMFLLTGNRLPDWAHRIVAVTTDFGVESGLTSHKYIMAVFCPAAASIDFQAEGDVGDAMDVEEHFDLTSALHIPGALHIVHNICKDVTEAMPHFPACRCTCELLLTS